MERAVRLACRVRCSCGDGAPAVGAARARVSDGIWLPVAGMRPSAVVIHRRHDKRSTSSARRTPAAVAEQKEAFRAGAKVLCATVRFGSGDDHNPIGDSLSPMVLFAKNELLALALVIAVTAAAGIAIQDLIWFRFVLL